MKKIAIILLLIPLLAITAYGEAVSLPPVPEQAQQYMPQENDSLGEGIAFILTRAISNLAPDLAEGCRLGLILLAMGLATTMIGAYSDSVKKMCGLVCVLSSTALLLGGSHSLITLGIDTVGQLNDYSKLLLPTMTTVLASSGAITKSAMLYAGCTIFSALLATAVKTAFIPMLYMYIAVCVADRVIGDAVFVNMKKLLKWLMTWLLKLILYVFTGYIAISGIVTGSADAVSLRATKITLSGMIPVVGGILSDASEAILVSASVLKNSIGISGMYAFFAICIGPVLKMLIHSVVLKIAGSLTGMFSLPEHIGIIDDFSQAMSLLLAATGANCLLLLISTVSFIQGVSL